MDINETIDLFNSGDNIRQEQQNLPEHTNMITIDIKKFDTTKLPDFEKMFGNMKPLSEVKEYIERIWGNKNE